MWPICVLACGLATFPSSQSMGFWPFYITYSVTEYQSTRAIFSSWTHFNTKCHACHMEQFNWMRLKNFLGASNSPKYLYSNRFHISNEPTPKALNVWFYHYIWYNFRRSFHAKRVHSTTAAWFMIVFFDRRKLSTVDLLTDKSKHTLFLDDWISFIIECRVNLQRTVWPLHTKRICIFLLKKAIFIQTSK